MRKNGFTLIELLVASTIIIVLTTIGLISYRQASVNSRNAKRKSDLETVRQALVLYYTDEHSYPSGSFSSMLTTLSGAGYISVADMSDPKEGTSPFGYTYQSNGRTFSICTYLEDDIPEQYCVYNP